MKRMINESQLRAIVAKSVKKVLNEQETVQQNHFSDLVEDARNKAVEIENQIEILQNQANTLMKIGPACDEADKKIKEQYQGIHGPIKDKFCYVYKFARPLRYNPKTYSYEGVDENFEETIEDLFPGEIRDAVRVYSIEKNNFLYGFKLFFDLDDIEGWY